MYKGTFIVRYDDTNPSKEKAEFQQSIIEDLALMGVHGDRVSYTSDYFDDIYKLAVQAIKDGKAYADDTLQERMRAERMDGIASARRDANVEENLTRFAGHDIRHRGGAAVVSPCKDVGGQPKQSYARSRHLSV